MMNAKFLLINEDFLQCVFALYLLFMYMYNVDRKDSNFFFLFQIGSSKGKNLQEFNYKLLYNFILKNSGKWNILICFQVNKFEIPMNEMRDRYKQIAGFHFISSYTGQVGDLCSIGWLL